MVNIVLDGSIDAVDLIAIYLQMVGNAMDDVTTIVAMFIATV